MRMWMVEPKAMCRQHLLGEHVELHMFVGSIKKDISMQGYVLKNLLEAQSIKSRHKALVREMTRRGMKHKSPLPEFVVPRDCRRIKIDRRKAFLDLVNRCGECWERAESCGL